MNNSNNTSNFAVIVGLITIFSRLIKWITVSILSFVKTFRTTILWMIVALIVLFMGKPAMIAFGVVALITAIIALVPLAVVLRNIGGKAGANNDKVRNVFNNIADIVEKFYPAFRKAVRVVSFVPDFQRFGKKINRLTARKTANDLFYDNEIFVVPEGASRRKDFDLYLQREHHGEVVKNDADPGNYVFYVGKGKNVLPQGMTSQQVDILVNDFLFEHTGAQQVNLVSLSKDPYFSKKYEFISNMPAEQVEGNEFIRFDAGIIPETDGSFYDVVANQTHNGFKVVFNEQVDRNTSGVIQKLNDYAKNNSIKYVNIDQQLGGKLSVDYILDVDKDIDDANDLLRNVGIVQKNDNKLYDVSMSNNSVGNPVLVINEQIGYQTVENVYDQLIKVRSNFGSKYVDLKKRNSDNDPWMTFEYIRTINKDVERAHDLLREAGVLDKNSAEIYDISMSINSDEGVFKLNEDIYGKNTQSIVKSVEGFKERFGAKVIRTTKKDNGKTEILFVIKDFLDEGKMFEGIPTLNLDDISIPSAVDPFGNDFYIRFAEVAGAVIMGQPGSGKTASALVFLSSIAASEDTVFDLIDCKGGADWNTISAGIDTHIRGAYTREDLERITEYLKELEEDMNDRIKNMENRLGYSSFWDKDLTAEDRRKAAVKYRMLVVDECQDLFGKAGNSSIDKELRNMYSDIETRLINLVKKGRSSGITVVFITQKPTQTSLPTDIRDNCAIRISFKVNSPGLVNLFFGLEGGVPVGQPSPVNIPKKRQGGAVLFNDDTQEFDEVRFYYIKPKVMKQYMEEAVSDERKEAKRKREEEVKEKAANTENDSTENTEETRSSRRTNNRFNKEEKVDENARRTSRASNREKEREEERNTGKEQTNSHNSSKTQEGNESKKTEQPVVKVEKEVFERKVKTVKLMLLKANDTAASDNERDTAKSRAVSIMKRFGITEDDLK